MRGGIFLTIVVRRFLKPFGLLMGFYLLSTSYLYAQPSFGITVTFSLYVNKTAVTKSQFDKKYQVFECTKKNVRPIAYNYNEESKIVTVTGSVVYNDLKINLVRGKDSMLLVFKTRGGKKRQFNIQKLQFKEGAFIISNPNTLALDLKNSRSNYYNALLASIDDRTFQQPNHPLKKEIDQLKLLYSIDDDDYEKKTEKELVPISTLKDSALLKKYKDYLYHKNFAEGGNDKIADGTITYSPDKLFKILVFQGESCGANCHTFYDSFVHFNLDKKVPDILETNFYPIGQILKIDNTHYLVIHSGFDGGGIYTHDNLAATLLTLDRNKLTVGKMSASPINSSNKSEKEIAIEQLQSDNEGSDFSLKFDPKTKILEYRYQLTNPETGDKRNYSGKLVYSAGVFRWLSKSG